MKYPDDVITNNSERKSLRNQSQPRGWWVTVNRRQEAAPPRMCVCGGAASCLRYPVTSHAVAIG